MEVTSTSSQHCPTEKYILLVTCLPCLYAVDAMLYASAGVSYAPVSVCLSVTRMYGLETATRIELFLLTRFLDYVLACTPNMKSLCLVTTKI